MVVSMLSLQMVSRLTVEPDDDDIAMPEGPPPGIDEPVNSDDEIPMPDDPAAGSYMISATSLLPTNSISRRRRAPSPSPRSSTPANRNEPTFASRTTPSTC